MIYYTPTSLQLNWLIKKMGTPNHYIGVYYVIETNVLVCNKANFSTSTATKREATPEQLRKLIWHVFNVKNIYL